MTNFALIVWSYQAQGSALTTALLSVCSYAPYVVMRDVYKRQLYFRVVCILTAIFLVGYGLLTFWMYNRQKRQRVRRAGGPGLSLIHI